MESSGRTGGVAGGLMPLSDGIVVEAAGGFTDVSVVVVVDPEAGIVAEVLVEAPVGAEPLHQSLLARVLGEAFR